MATVHLPGVHIQLFADDAVRNGDGAITTAAVFSTESDFQVSFYSLPDRKMTSARTLPVLKSKIVIPACIIVQSTPVLGCRI